MEKKFTEKRNAKSSTKICLLIIMAVVITGAVLMYARSMRVNLEQQAYYSVQQNTREIAKAIDASIGYARSSIRLTSQSATQSMDSDVIDDVNSILDPLLDSTPFNFIEYILADGWNTMNDGGEPFDASDREYYKQGIRGNTGIWVNYTPKKSKEVLLNFYTPLYYEGEIVGVFTGTLGGNTNIKPLLASTFFDEELLGFLCDEDGNIIATTAAGLETNTNIRDYMTQNMGVNKENYEIFAAHVRDSGEEAFSFREKEGKSIGCISGIKGTGWYIAEIVPARSLANIMNTTTVQTALVIGLIIVIFSLYLFSVNREMKKRKEQEIAEYLGVIEVLSKEYSSVYLIDTETKKATAYRVSGGIQKYYGSALQEEIIWEDGLADYAQRFVKKEYKEELVQKCSLANLTRQLKNEEDLFSYEYINDRDGMQRVFRIMGTLLPESNGKYIVVGFADIHEEREKELAMQKTLQEACRNAEKANKAKSTFLFNMSHDIRTPMNAIIGFAQLALQNREYPDKLLDYLKKIKSSSDYLLNLLNGVLEMARIENGKITLDREPADLTEVCSTTFSLFEKEAEKKDLRYIHELRFEPMFANIDRVRVEEILSNIISNAVKYTGKGGSVRIFVSVQEKSGEECILTAVVEDTGIGMSKEFLPHIFESFERERSAAAAEIQGTGLGMGITKQLVDIMDGTIDVESEVGKGTRVSVTIPFLRVPMPEMRDEESTADIQHFSFAGKRILLAEDNELNAEIAIEILKEAGIDTEWARDGVECVSMLTKADTGYYDAVLMDIQMPNLNGYLTTKKIRRLKDPGKAQITIIAMTANAFEDDRKEAMDVGMNGFVAKPVEIHRLLEVLAKVMPQRCDNA